MIALSAVLVLGAIGMACGDSGANNAMVNANKALVNAANAAQSAVNAAQSAANQLSAAANAAANAASSSANAMKGAPPANAMKPANTTGKSDADMLMWRWISLTKPSLTVVDLSKVCERPRQMAGLFCI